MRKKLSTLMVYILVGLLSVAVLPYPAYSLLSLGGATVVFNTITDFLHGTGAGNPDKKPSMVRMRTDFLTATVRCQNPGNNAETANGSPFNVSGSVGGSIPITDAQVDDKGNFDVTFFISDQQINDNITITGDASCKNNWTVVPGSLKLNTFQQNFKAFLCTDLTCTTPTTTVPLDENTILCTVNNLPPNRVGCVVTFDAGGKLFTVNAS